MAHILEHNPNLPEVEAVIPHRRPRKFLDGVLSVVQIPFDQYEFDGKFSLEEFLARYDEFQEHEKPTQPTDPIIVADGFWTPARIGAFRGHFPRLPVLQGVQQTEAAGQLGAYAAMYEKPGELGVF